MAINRPRSNGEERPGLNSLGRRFTGLFLATLVLLIIVSSHAVAQDSSDDIAPPPLKIMSKGERTELNQKNDPKGRTEIALQLMDARLRSAEKFRGEENYTLMYDELGGFHALMDNTLDYLLHAGSNEGKRLSGLKKLDIGLREFVPRIEVLRRELPFNFDPYLKKLIKYIGDAREKAIQPFFGDTVIQDKPN